MFAFLTPFVQGAVDAVEDWLGFGTNQANKDINRESMNFQREQNELNRNWQSDENQKSRNFEHDESLINSMRNQRNWKEQFGMQSAEWYAQQDYNMRNWYAQQEYNSPKNQVSRAREAGYNASAVGSSGDGLQNSQSIIAPSSVPTGGTPSGGSYPAPTANSPSMSPTPNMIPMQNNFGANFLTAIGSFIKDISGSRLSDAQAHSLTTKLEVEMETMKAISEQESFKSYILSLTKDYSVKQKAAEYFNTLKLGALYDMQGDETLARIENYQMDSLLKHLKGKVTDAEYKTIEATLPYISKKIQTEISTTQAQGHAFNAQAFRDIQTGNSIKEMLPLQKNLLEIQHDLMNEQKYGLSLDNYLKDSTNQERIKIVIEQAKQAKLITQETAYKLANDIYHYNTRKVESFFRWLGSAAGAYRDIGIGSNMFNAFSGKGKSTPFDSPWTVYGGAPGSDTYGATWNY